MNLTSLLNIRWENFFQEYFLKDNIPDYYTPIRNVPTTPAIKLKIANKKAMPGGIAIINCIPPYLKSSSESLLPGLTSVDKYFRQGYLVDFTGFETPEHYLKEQFQSKSLKNMRRLTRRLLEDKSIYFKTYYGSIERPDYEKHMEFLKNMIQERFGKRATSHSALQHWEDYVVTGFEMINRKKASLLAIYSGDKPICIGLSYHRSRVMYSAITSFDKAFDKFGLSKILFVERIKWCFEHNYTYLDLAWGDLPYKKQLVNKVYKYKTQIIYRENSIRYRFFAHLLGYFLEKKYEMQLRVKR